ncbi:MAG: hypothetical protein A3G32_07905 [Deltaproteobacteria bacterium RIFCSPLOWO2_12_FULL_40_28]|nr:MAG: hypothetical protein A3C45_00605 [Deltaproteobacteria bacterium RIFCSPHIGHO2_02_FULL_40_28]OGQ21028.1 MAG: hypothetical protein A3E27_03270 [Deltaproteobacteria bacterium RIFCSPHIGHO2_12_FULL_40_32]OGQ39429.1 MAG: hypothetical protein A3I69_04630 [Deltaproteobacteria bacterium RIFCSPLOWO2_02_FULL_40_36]OGQ54709.1 MAG: hypothetical protein A3G32_07905 [Deltaproteobacteria bacterium RIFCSPLOWO2_12_FULL_40_28]
MQKLLTQIKNTQKARRFFIALIGGTVLLIGIAMIVLPGPALVVIPLGLAVLASEFVWAKKVLGHFKKGHQKIRKMLGKPLKHYKECP